MKHIYLSITLFIFGIAGYASVNDSLVLDYNFSDTLDASSYDNHFINHNATYVEDRFGIPNGAIAFNGVDSWLEIPSDTSYQVRDFPFTTTFWFLTNDTTNSNAYFFNGTSYGNYGGVLISSGTSSITGKSYIALNYGDGRGAGPNDRKTHLVGPVKENTWHQLTVVSHRYDSTEMYLDGHKKEIFYDGNGKSFGYPTSIPNGSMGAHTAVSPKKYADGAIDDLKMWNVALSEEEVLKLYTPNDPDLVLDYSFEDTLDASNYENHFINHNAEYVEDRFGNPEAAIAFDGVDSWLEIPSDTSYQVREFPFTTSFWFMSNDTTNANAYFFNGTSYGNYGGVLISSGTSSITGKSYVALNYGDGRGAGPNDRKTHLVGPVEESKWHQLTVVSHRYDSTEMYLDGDKKEIFYDGNGKSFGYPSSIPNGSMGAHTAVSPKKYADGALDDLKMWRRALSEEEVIALYTPAIVIEDPLSLNEMMSIESSIFYPNPVNSEINFYEHLEAVTIFSVNGEEMMSMNDTQKVNVSQLESGMYILKGVTSQGVSIQSKLVKK